MTKREAAIVSAYTGYLIGEFSDFQDYAEEVMERPIFTHELSDTKLITEIKNKAAKDFKGIKITETKVDPSWFRKEIAMGCKFKNRCPSYSGWCEGINYPMEHCISYILDDYENEKKKTEDLEWLYHSRFERDSWVDFDAVEKALGFRLFGYQKSYVLGQGFRQMGRTTAEILRMLFDKEQYDNPIDFSDPPRNRQKHVFRQQFRDIWEKLHDAGIEMRPVFWNIEDKKKYGAEHRDYYKYDKGEQSNPPEFLAKYMNIRVPDCNDCGYLNFTEKEQRDYGINSYKKDYRCRCYGRPVYHRANSTKHDSYIYPCDECREDDFVNYYDCESSKKGE